MKQHNIIKMQNVLIEVAIVLYCFIQPSLRIFLI
jgi:hypothetical protein